MKGKVGGGWGELGGGGGVSQQTPHFKNSFYSCLSIKCVESSSEHKQIYYHYIISLFSVIFKELWDYFYLSNFLCFCTPRIRSTDANSILFFKWNVVLNLYGHN